MQNSITFNTKGKNSDSTAFQLIKSSGSLLLNYYSGSIYPTTLFEFSSSGVMIGTASYALNGSGGGPTPTLQQVTTEGSSSTDSIYVNSVYVYEPYSPPNYRKGLSVVDGEWYIGDSLVSSQNYLLIGNVTLEPSSSLTNSIILNWPVLPLDGINIPRRTLVTSINNIRASANGNATITGGSDTQIQFNSGSAFSGSNNLRFNYVNNNLLLTGSLNVSGSGAFTQFVTASAALFSGSGIQRLRVIGSGSADPLFQVLGSQGELFTVTDSLSGSLFSVNDISGLTVLEAFSDSTVLIGSYQAPALNTTVLLPSTVTSSANIIYTVPTASYDAIYIDYVIRSGSVGRAGTFTAMWSGSSTSVSDISVTPFGDTSGFVFGANISGSNLLISGSCTTAGWRVKTIIRSI